MSDNTCGEDRSQEPVDNSLKLALLATALSALADIIALLSVLESVNEAEEAAEKEKQAQKDLEMKLQNMQDQIDSLTAQIEHMKKKQ